MKNKISKFLRSALIIGVIIFLGLWFFGIIQINGATFNIVDASVTTYWDYDEEEDTDPYPIIPSKARQAYEHALIELQPDFNQMLNEYIQGEWIVGLSATFNDGNTVVSEGTDYNICIYPENLKISKTRIKPFHHKYSLSDSNIFEFEYKVPYYGARSGYHQSHSMNLNIDVEINGIYSKSYLDYKLKEIYLYYSLDALRQHVQAKEQFLATPYLDTIPHFMFVKDNFEIGKEEFLNLDPRDFHSMNWLPSRESMNYYTDDEEMYGVLIATSK